MKTTHSTFTEWTNAQLPQVVIHVVVHNDEFQALGHTLDVGKVFDLLEKSKLELSRADSFHAAKHIREALVRIAAHMPYGS